MNAQPNNTMLSMMKRVACLAFALSALALGGCATQGQRLQADTSSAPLHDYLIGPGDSLSITVWRNPEVSMSVLDRAGARH